MAFSLSRKLRVFPRQKRANAAIEFTLIAPIFFTLLLGIIEVGTLYYSQNVLQYATQTAGRLIRTGTAQGTSFATAAKCSGGAGGSGAGGAYATAQEWFKDQVCCGISGVLNDCSRLHVSVQNYTGGFGSDFSNTTDANGLLVPVADTYSPGSPCDVVLLRSSYNWNVIGPGISWFLVNTANYQHLMSATAAFRNEPFTSAVAGC